MGALSHFLISRLSALGDVVCSLPVASALKAAVPDCEITWVVDPRFAGIVECCPVVNHVIKAKPGFKPKTWPELSIQPDAAFDLQGLLKSAIVLKGLKCPRYGYHWQREGASLFSTPVLPDPSSFHIVDQYLDVVRSYLSDVSLPVPNGPAEFSLAPHPDDLSSVESKAGTSPYAVINPGAAWVTKRWPSAYFSEVIDWLASKGVASVLIGGKASADIESAQAVSEGCKSKPVSLVGQTSVRELVALISRSELHIGGDTGSTHIAAGLGVPAIGLYSITRPKRSCPYGQVNNCLYDPDALSNITVKQALSRIETYVQAL